MYLFARTVAEYFSTSGSTHSRTTNSSASSRVVKVGNSRWEKVWIPSWNTLGKFAVWTQAARFTNGRSRVVTTLRRATASFVNCASEVRDNKQGISGLGGDDLFYVVGQGFDFLGCAVREVEEEDLPIPVSDELNPIHNLASLG